jgi:hypothetical protein
LDPRRSVLIARTAGNRLLLGVRKPAAEGAPDHIGAEGTVRLYFVEAAAALSVGRSARAEESRTAILQAAKLVIGRMALAGATGGIAGHPRVNRRQENAPSECA